MFKQSFEDLNMDQTNDPTSLEVCCPCHLCFSGGELRFVCYLTHRLVALVRVLVELMITIYLLLNTREAYISRLN